MSRFHQKLSANIFLVLGLSLPFAAISSEVCQISVVDQKSVKSRSFQISMPGGKTVVIIGHDHGIRNMDRIMEDLLSDKNASNEQFLEKIRVLNVNFKRAGAQSALDLQYLKENLINMKPGSFLGYEATQRITESNLKWAKELKRRVLAELTRRGLGDLSAVPSMDSLVLVATGAILYSNVFLPELTQHISLIGIEDGIVEEKWRVALQEKKRSSEVIWQFEAQDPVFFKQLGSTELSLGSSYSKFNYDRDAKALLDAVEKNAPEKYKKAALDWLQGILTEMKVRQERDIATGRLISAQENSGVIILGESHRRRLADLVFENCEKAR